MPQSIVRITLTGLLPCVLLTLLSSVNAAHAQFVDGALRIRPPQANQAAAPTRLVRPDLHAGRIELPQTVVPQEEILAWEAEHSDLNGDHVVDDADLSVMLL